MDGVFTEGTGPLGGWDRRRFRDRACGRDRACPVPTTPAQPGNLKVVTIKTEIMVCHSLSHSGEISLTRLSMSIMGSKGC